MHPALSVIVFTTASGAGYGLIALVGVLLPFGLIPTARGFGLAALALALALVTGGLLASMLHLGHPERAWRAFFQWRSSWLSREGLLALATYVPVSALAIRWVVLDRVDAWARAASLLAAVLALTTILSTAMIYRSLKPVHQWHNAHVIPGYLCLGVMSGALWLHALVQLTGEPEGVIGGLAIVLIALAACAKLRYWRFIDTTIAASTPESATGLAAMGQVRLLEPPHTEENYLLKEMGFVIARRHGAKLRRIALVAGFAVPFALTALTIALDPGWLAASAAVAASLCAMAGLLIERWLFFAQAKHTVMLYHGARRA
jgi:DMSO reductase anchor subunit